MISEDLSKVLPMTKRSLKIFPLSPSEDLLEDPYDSVNDLWGSLHYVFPIAYFYCSWNQNLSVLELHWKMGHAKKI